MTNKIICIGREFGSGGHEIAVRAAERLGIKVYEKDLVHLACKYGDLAEKTLEAYDEKAANPYLYQTVHEGNYHVTRGLPTSEVLYKLQSHEIRRIAKNESCIFVGRCADYVLKNSDSHILRVFVSAPEADRVKRKTEQENLPRLRAIKLVRKMDAQRRKYYEHYTGQRWGEPKNYDLYLNTGKISIAQAVELLVQWYGM